MKEKLLNCIIVEDEPLAAEILKDYIAELPALNLLEHCTDAIAALDVLKNHTVDLVFLDINLPKLKGFDFLNTLRVRPEVIITSAFHEYALKGFEYNVVDYLLKPIDFARFLNAVNKVLDKHKQPRVAQPVSSESLQRKFLFFNVGKKNVKLFIDEISYVESVREYVKIFYNGKFLLTKVKISDIEQSLLSHDFVRVHRSYIVNIAKIDSFTQFELEVANKLLPVSRSYKDKLRERLERFS